MADDTPSQKDISDKYQGNLRYFRQAHPLRRLRLWMFVGVAVVTVLGVMSYPYWGKDDVFSPGPISESHAHFASDCVSCHAGVETSVFASLPSVLKTADLSGMDQSCLNCHPTMGLHLPQANRLGLSAVADGLAVVHATGCATCHREHVGRSRIAMPERQSCIDCHDDDQKLRLSPQRIELTGKAVAKTGENRNLGDGLVRFLSPSRPVGTLKPFSTYAVGHPPFDYEHPDRRDPARLFYNHERHLRDDIPKVQGRQLDCVYCHQPGPGGTHQQPVNYETHCQECHSLQIHPTLPNLLVPHGDPEKTRYFLASLKSILAPTEWEALQTRGLRTLADFERRVFFEGDPPVGKGLDNSRPGVRKFLTECAKCHTVTRTDDGTPPKIPAPNLAERWVQHGPFTHLPHQHIACVDCHVKALTSKDTKDILLPPQTLCAECHRPTTRGTPLAADQDSQLPVSIESNSLAARQVKIGGIKSDCQGCHFFHAPPNAQEALRRR